MSPAAKTAPKPEPEDRSYLSTDQIRHLLQFVNQLRVGHANGRSNMEAYDIRAHLNRIFGFGRWSAEITSMDLIYEAQTTIGKAQAPGVDVAYKAACQLTVCAPDGTRLCRYTEWAVGAQKMGVASRGDVHDFAIKTAESQALKRAAINLGDQFGLSLYNHGSMDALVMGTLVWPEHRQVEALPEITKQLGAESDPDTIPEVQYSDAQVTGPGVGNPAMSTPAIHAAAEAATAADQGQASPTTHGEGSKPLMGPTVSPVQGDIEEIRESIGFLDRDASGRLQILWKRADLTPLARMTTPEEIARAWELYAQVIPAAPVPDGPPAVMEDPEDPWVETGQTDPAAQSVERQRQVEQARRAFMGNRDDQGFYDPERNPQN